MRHAFTFVSASVGVIPVGGGGLVVSGGGLVVSGFALPPRRLRGRTAVPGERRAGPRSARSTTYSTMGEPPSAGGAHSKRAERASTAVTMHAAGAEGVRAGLGGLATPGSGERAGGRAGVAGFQPPASRREVGGLTV